jgi:hypothetical protein
MRYGILVVAFAALLACQFGLVRAQPPGQGRKEPLVDQVRRAIDKGIKFLRQEQRPGGSWDEAAIAINHRGGATCLALLALLNAGVPRDDPVITNGLRFIRGLSQPTTYVRSLQTMVYAEAGFNEDRGRIQQSVDHLIKTRVVRDGRLEGWSYDYAGNRNARADNSNTQYALLGLHMGRIGGAKIDATIWTEIRDFYKRTQNEDGGWDYVPNDRGPFRKEGSTLTMTTAGLCGLLIAGMELNPGREEMRPDGTAANCGVYDENNEVRRALSWISSPQVDHFDLQRKRQGGVFYNLYGIERAGRLSGLRFFHAHDWYREGCKFLVARQHERGYWVLSNSNFDSWSVVSTSFALLFLSKGRTPVLISKLAHGDPDRRQTTDQDWNNDRNDCRNLVAYAGPQLWERLPLAWQTFDMLRAAEARPGANLTEEDYLEVTSDLLQSPILYFNGHKSPARRFTAVEKELLKKYVDNGGFILAEACCGRKEFDRGFRELCAELWEDVELTPLPIGHPIWRAHFDVKAGSFKLHGLQMGCKTVLVYSPEDMSCLWEQNRQDTARGELAFRVGTNIIAYATGKEPPKPRLTKVDLVSVKDEGRQIPRGFLKVAQVQHAGDWHPAPRAMPRLMGYLRERAGVDVALKTEEILLRSDTRSIIDFKFVYMHGRKDFMQEHGYSDEDLKNLRFSLENGGLLFADACCGKKGFDEGFRKFVARLLPKYKLEPINPQEELKEGGLFSADLNGVALTHENIRCRVEPKAEFRHMAPALEGIKINGRWAVIYSRYDIGCALERATSSDCLGYDTESAQRIAGAAVLYTLRP